MNTITLSQEGTKQAIELAIKADVPLFITGQFGTGKSTIVKEIADKYNLHLVDFRLSQVTPYDCLGYPKDVNGKMEYLPIANMVLEGEEIPDNKEGVLLFLDELNSADKYVQGASYRLLLDREIGKYKLHPNTRIICAGNRIQDNGLVNKLLAPVKTRVSHIEMIVDTKEFLNYVYNETSKGNWNSLVYAFLEFKPEYINNYDPTVDCHTYAVPRSWHFLSKQLDAGLEDLSPDIRTNIICGIVGDSAGLDFSSFLDTMNLIPSIQDIVNDPKNTPIPNDIGAKWALGIYLSRHLDKTNEDAIIEYCTRVSEPDLRVVIYRYLVMKNKLLMKNPVIQSTLIQTQKTLVGI